MPPLSQNAVQPHLWRLGARLSAFPQVEARVCLRGQAVKCRFYESGRSTASAPVSSAPEKSDQLSTKETAADARVKGNPGNTRLLLILSSIVSSLLRVAVRAWRAAWRIRTRQRNDTATHLDIPIPLLASFLHGGHLAEIAPATWPLTSGVQVV